MSTGRLLSAMLALAASGCSSGDDWPRIIGQSLYNLGHYACTQSAHCDAAGDHPGDTDNRR